MIKLCNALPALVFLVLAQLPTATAWAEPPELGILLRPTTGKDESPVAGLEVTVRITQVTPGSAEPLLELAEVTFNVPSMAGQVEILDAHDAAGALPLEARDEGEANARTRRWYAKRPVEAPVTVTYRVPVDAAPAPRGPAPPTELRNDAGAVSGAGASFLLRPLRGEYVMRVAWDLSALPAGATAVSSLGYAPGQALPVSTLDSVYFMAGQLGHFPDPPDQQAFFSAWQGSPPFDAARLMDAARSLREGFGAFFTAAPGGYGIMLRPNPVNAGGGIGLHRSFVLTFDQDTDEKDLAFTLSHEMFHTFQPRLDAGGGPNSSLETAWFNEGLAVFYQREFLFRAGAIDTHAYLADLNVHAARYYTNALGNTPNSEVTAGFWRDTRIRTLPYDRGFLYFATVDEALRKASGGRRSLDDLVKELRQLQDAGQQLLRADWERLVLRELGEAGPMALQAMLNGEAPLPTADAFGPCFTRTTRQLKRYELGFDPAVLVGNPRIVTGLVARSAAEAAGLRDGDEILRPVPQDAIQGDQQARLKLLIRRGTEEFEVEYLPRGETVPAWQWKRVEDVPEEVCRAARVG